jgi:hypothetical protein
MPPVEKTKPNNSDQGFSECMSLVLAQHTAQPRNVGCSRNSRSCFVRSIGPCFSDLAPVCNSIRVPRDFSRRVQCLRRHCAKLLAQIILNMVVRSRAPRNCAAVTARLEADANQGD